MVDWCDNPSKRGPCSPRQKAGGYLLHNDDLSRKCAPCLRPLSFCIMNRVTLLLPCCSRQCTNERPLMLMVLFHQSRRYPARDEKGCVNNEYFRRKCLFLRVQINHVFTIFQWQCMLRERLSFQRPTPGTRVIQQTPVSPAPDDI